MNLDAQDNNHNDSDSLLICPNGDLPCSYLSEIITLRDEIEHLTQQIRTDALTGLYNFRFFSEALAIEMERTRRSLQPLALILLDVDNFKAFNDQWGHELGNKALFHVAQLISLAIRKLDMACRYGGEEFVIILPNTDLRQAVQVAGRLREMIETRSFVMEKHGPVTITASLGIDSFTFRDGDTADNLVQRADSWLYRAKRNGRNCLAHPTLNESLLIASVTLEEKEALLNP